jgi:hypothetical protein
MKNIEPEAVWLADDDPNDPAWSAAIASCWESDWSDLREDVYSLEDGKSE